MRSSPDAVRDDDPDGDQDAAPDVDAWIRQAGQADPDPTLGDNALWALAYCAPESIAALCEHLNHLDATVRKRAAHALGNIGPAACEAAATPLRQRLSDAQGPVRQRAAWALGPLRDVHADTVRGLLALVVDGDLKDAGAALHALKAVTPGVLLPAAVSRLLPGLAAPGREASLTCEVLALMRPKATDALPALTQCLADTTDPRGAWAAHALGEMGPTAAPAVNALTACAAADADAAVAEAARESLRAIQGAPH